MYMMSRVTGKRIPDLDHLRQSIADILTTRKVTRVMLREYGSDYLDMVDRPVTATWGIDLYYEVAVALYDYEPRIRLTDILLDGSKLAEGWISMQLIGKYWPNGKPVSIDHLEIRVVPEGTLNSGELLSYQPV